MGKYKHKHYKQSRSNHGVRKVLIRRDGTLCHYCEVSMTMPKGEGEQTPDTMTIDHVVPLSLGGSEQVKNMVLACYSCNNGLDSRTDKCYCSFCGAAYKEHGLGHMIGV